MDFTGHGISSGQSLGEKSLELAFVLGIQTIDGLLKAKLRLGGAKHVE